MFEKRKPLPLPQPASALALVGPASTLLEFDHAIERANTSHAAAQRATLEARESVDRLSDDLTVHGQREGQARLALHACEVQEWDGTAAHHVEVVAPLATALQLAESLTRRTRALHAEAVTRLTKCERDEQSAAHEVDSARAQRDRHEQNAQLEIMRTSISDFCAALVRATTLERSDYNGLISRAAAIVRQVIAQQPPSAGSPILGMLFLR